MRKPLLCSSPSALRKSSRKPRRIGELPGWKSAVSCLAGVTVLFAVTFVLPAVAAARSLAPTTESPAVQAHAAQWYAEHYGVSTSRAYRYLQIQDAATTVLDKVSAALGSQWAGAWFDAKDSGRLKVAVVSSKSEPTGPDVQQAQDRLAVQGVAAFTDFVGVRSSWGDLEAAQADLDSQLSDLLAAGQIQTSIDPGSNSVLVQTASDLSAEQGSRVQSAVTASGDEAKVERESDRATFKPQPLACVGRSGPFSSSELFCDPPLRGGTMISAGGFACTAGFLVFSLSDSQPYLMTAGHCLQDAIGSIWRTRFADGSLHDIGFRHSHTLGSSGDFGIIGIRNPSGWNVTRNAYVFVGASSNSYATTTRDEAYRINQAAHAPAGTIVCATSGLRVPVTNTHTNCGVVIRVDASNAGTDHLAEANFCATPGSSGGPVYKNHNGYGLVVSRGNNDCDIYYQGLLRANSGSNVGIP